MGDTFMAQSGPELRNYLGLGVNLFTTGPIGPPKANARILNIDLAKDTNALPLNQTNYQETYSDSFAQISHQLTTEAGLEGSYGDFSGEVKAKYGISEERIEKTHFLKISFIASATVDRIEKPEKHLDEDFKTALATMEPYALFEKYGTHLIDNIITGGRAEYYCWSSDTTTLSEREFRLAAKAKYASLGGSIEGSSDTSTVDKSKIQLVQGSTTVSTIGGSAAGGFAAADPTKWSTWVNSIGGNPGFLGFQGKLKPIWELADAARSAQIRTGYQKEAAKALRTAIFSATSKVMPHPEATVTVYLPYKLVGGGARGNYNYDGGKGNYLTASFPENLNTWKAVGKNHRFYGDDASITAFAVAIYDPDNLWDVTVSKSAQTASAAKLDQPVTNNYTLVGGGGRVLPMDTDHFLIESCPFWQNWRVRSQDLDGAPSPASVEASAIGLKCNIPGIRVETHVQIATSSGSYRPDSTTAVASGYKMTCGGAMIDLTHPGLFLTGSYPVDLNIWKGLGKDVADHHSENAIMSHTLGVKVIDA